jgi:hypothetical protein
MPALVEWRLEESLKLQSTRHRLHKSSYWLSPGPSEAHQTRKAIELLMDRTVAVFESNLAK